MGQHSYTVYQDVGFNSFLIGGHFGTQLLLVTSCLSTLGSCGDVSLVQKASHSCTEECAAYHQCFVWGRGGGKFVSLEFCFLAPPPVEVLCMQHNPCLHSAYIQVHHCTWQALPDLLPQATKCWGEKAWSHSQAFYMFIHLQCLNACGMQSKTGGMEGLEMRLGSPGCQCWGQKFGS